VDRELERVIARLEARFDAALAHEEEEAARDLEASLRQDRTLSELVRAGVPLRLLEGDGSMLPVTVVGADYCGTGLPLTCVRTLGSTPLVAEVEGRVPEARRDSLHEVARRWSRGGCGVQVGLETENLSGRLVQVGPDNLVLEAAAGRTIVPLWLVRSIRLAHEG
jgi:hypothetical protein